MEGVRKMVARMAGGKKGGGKSYMILLQSCFLKEIYVNIRYISLNLEKGRN